MALRRASVEVRWRLCCFLLPVFNEFTHLTLFMSNLAAFSVSVKQPNQMEELVSTTTRFTRTGKSSVQTANTSALAWTALLDACPSARVSSRCPNWAVPSPGGSRCRDGAVNNSSAPEKQRRRALWERSTGKSTAKREDPLKKTLPTGMSWLLCGEESQSLYLVSSYTQCPFQWHLQPDIRKYM